MTTDAELLEANKDVVNRMAGRFFVWVDEYVEHLETGGVEELIQELFLLAAKELLKPADCLKCKHSEESLEPKDETSEDRAALQKYPLKIWKEAKEVFEPKKQLSDDYSITKTPSIKLDENELCDLTLEPKDERQVEGNDTTLSDKENSSTQNVETGDNCLPVRQIREPKGADK